MAAARAELIEDRGEAASSGEFFRSPEFLAAEGTTHTLRVEGEIAGEPIELTAPVLVREIGDGLGRDAASPYSYPGIVPGTEADGAYTAIDAFAESAPLDLDPAAIDFSATGLVSLFLRHRLGPPPLAGSTPRNLVQIADPALPAKSRPSDRRQVRRNLEDGYELCLIPGSETTAEQRAGFLDVYEQTMRRTEAAANYFFGAAYFDRILAAPRTWLALAQAPDGALAAASIATVSDGFLHYYLSGSADSHLRDSPMKNVVSRLIEHAAELQLPLNLGGGITPGDALEEFKRGFANRDLRWHTSEVICDPERYAKLSADRDAGGFFPAYRAPS
jgi:GNAT acetyltransferase-like protein